MSLIFGSTGPRIFRCHRLVATLFRDCSITGPDAHSGFWIDSDGALIVDRCWNCHVDDIPREDCEVSGKVFQPLVEEDVKPTVDDHTQSEHCLTVLEKASKDSQAGSSDLDPPSVTPEASTKVPTGTSNISQTSRPGDPTSEGSRVPPTRAAYVELIEPDDGLSSWTRPSIPTASSSNAGSSRAPAPAPFLPPNKDPAPAPFLPKNKKPAPAPFLALVKPAKKPSSALRIDDELLGFRPTSALDPTSTSVRASFSRDSLSNKAGHNDLPSNSTGPMRKAAPAPRSNAALDLNDAISIFRYTETHPPPSDLGFRIWRDHMSPVSDLTKAQQKIKDLDRQSIKWKQEKEAFARKLKTVEGEKHGVAKERDDLKNQLASVEREKRKLESEVEEHRRKVPKIDRDYQAKSKEVLRGAPPIPSSTDKNKDEKPELLELENQRLRKELQQCKAWMDRVRQATRQM